MTSPLSTPLTLPCGAVMANRLCKAAMTERLSQTDFQPNERHFELYRKWTEAGAGLQITGNIMVEPGHMESAGNVVLDANADLDKYRQWTKICKDRGNHIWAQVSHSGRQTSKFIRFRPKSASDVQLKKMGLFGRPVPLTASEIEGLIDRFALTGSLVRETGFTGIQVHAAHGYLISQFLSPRTNRRTDRWGGSIENRSRLLREIIRRIRKSNGPGFPISVKLNSADFQRGGFSEEDSMWVVRMLEEEGVDLVEISGGTYEKLAFFESDDSVKDSTRQREAYFMDFADQLRQQSGIRIMVTGGFRSTRFMEKVLQEDQLDMIGMARPFIYDLGLIPGILQGEEITLSSPVIRSSVPALNDSAEGGYYARQIFRLSKGKPVRKKTSASLSSIWLINMEMSKAFAKKIS